MGTQGLVTVMMGGEVAAKITVGSDGFNAMKVGMDIVKSLRDVDLTLLEAIADNRGFGNKADRVIAVRQGAFGTQRNTGDVHVRWDEGDDIVVPLGHPALGLVVKHFDEPTFNSRWRHGTADHCVIVDLDAGTLVEATHQKKTSAEEDGTHTIVVEKDSEPIRLCEACYKRYMNAYT